MQRGVLPAEPALRDAEGSAAIRPEIPAPDVETEPAAGSFLPHASAETRERPGTAARHGREVPLRAGLAALAVVRLGPAAPAPGAPGSAGKSSF